MNKYLDIEGLKYLWQKIESKTDSLVYETININAISNQGISINTNIIVTTGDGSETFTYMGAPIVLKIKGGEEYTVAFNDISDHKTPESVTYTAVAGNVRSITGDYNATLLTVNVTGISNQSVTVAYGGVSKTVANGGTLLIPYNQSVTISAATISNYTTPTTQTFVTNTNSKTVTMEYKSVVLTINITGLNGATVQATVSGSGTSTQKVSHGGTARVPYNASVTISVPAVDGYQSPNNITNSYTSNSTITMAYSEIKGGVFILDTSGNLHAVSSWSGGSNATGVVLINDNVSLIIAPDEWYTYESGGEGAWNGNKRSAWGGVEKNVTGIKTTISDSDAITDFAGSANTTAIINQLSGTTDSYSSYYTGAPAAEYCRAYSKGCKGAGQWYLPAAGEMNQLVINKTAINEALNKISGEVLENHKYTWTSTQYDSDLAWIYYWGGEYFNYSLKNLRIGVRPVCAF